MREISPAGDSYCCYRQENAREYLFADNFIKLFIIVLISEEMIITLGKYPLK